MKIKKSLLSGSTPMLVLSLLKDGDKYGYEIIEALARCSDDTFQQKQGSLYPLLHELEKSGYIKSCIATAPTGRDRKYYCLTRSGGRYLRHAEKKNTIFTGQVNAVIRPVSY